MSTTHGRFVWYDLMTGDVEASRAFYTETIGYKTQTWEGRTPYTMLSVGLRPVGGLLELPADVQRAGVPSHWLAYVAVGDVDASAKKAVSLGAKILKNPTDIPTVGRFAVLTDPQGATFALFKSKKDIPPYDRDPQPGDFTWHELNTTDYEGAWTFYQELFGWKPTTAMDMGPKLGTYFMFNHAEAAGETSMGGMSNVAKLRGSPAHWLYYATVDDLDGAIERIRRHGGLITNGPMEVPGGDMIAQCRDPQGAAFAIHLRR